MSDLVTGPGSLAVVVAVVAVAAVVQLASGFGFALLCVPLLALVLDPHVAVVVAILLGLFGAVYQAVAGRGHVERGVVLRLLGASLVGMPLGLYVYAHSSAELLKVGIGAMILVATALLACGFRLREASSPVDLAVGLLTGFLNTSTGTGGPPVVAVLQARAVSADVFRSTASLVFVVVDLAAVAGFALRGDVTWPLALLTLCTLPGMALGSWVGVRVRPLLSAETFRVLVLVLLGLSGLTAIGTALL
jgi:uncharacterized membrane protein YfcA